MANYRAIEIFNDSRQKLITIQSVNFRYSKTNANCFLYGSIEPMAVLICTPDGITVLDVDTEKTNLDKLRQEIPELDNLIATV